VAAAEVLAEAVGELGENVDVKALHLGYFEISLMIPWKLDLAVPCSLSNHSMYSVVVGSFVVGIEDLRLDVYFHRRVQATLLRRVGEP
jgi:hypothetical protein